MKPSRRTLFRSLAAAGATTPMLHMAEQLADAAQADPQMDAQVLNFWDKGVRAPAARSRGKGPRTPSYSREPAFLYFHREKGIQMASSMDEEGLAASGNMEVEFTLRSHRLSREDQEKFESMSTGTLRIDVGQHRPFQDIQDLLVWTVMGGMAPNAEDKNVATKAFRDYQVGSRAPVSSTSKVRLPGGTGWSTVNFFLKQKQSIWGSVLSLFLRVDQAFVPMLGLPAMAQQGLAALDSFVGKMHSQGGVGSHSWIFQNNRTDFCCSVAALKQSPDDVVRMRNGTYVLVPAEHLEEFESERKNLKLSSGFLVPKSASDFQARSRIADTLPDVTYVTVQTRVQPV